MSLLLLFPAAEQAAPVTSTAAFSQVGTWAATTSERIPASAAFTQAGSWAAYATSIRPVSATAAFSQTATWTGQAGSLLTISGTGTFGQSASWAAESTQTDLSVAATASFVQARMMSGVGGTVQLKIMGYASPEPPQRFLESTGTALEEWVP